MTDHLVLPSADDDQTSATAYADREACDPMTGEDVLWRTYWRVRELSRADDYDALRAYVGPHGSIHGVYLVEVRQSHNGVWATPWQYFDTCKTRDEALVTTDHPRTAVDPRLIEIEAEAAQRAADESEAGRRKAEETDRKMRHRASRECGRRTFERLLERGGKDRVLCREYNAMVSFVTEHHQDVMEDLYADECFRTDYEDYLCEYRLPSKRKKMREITVRIKAALPKRASRPRVLIEEE